MGGWLPWLPQTAKHWQFGLVAASTAALTACFQAVSYELFVLVYRVGNADWTNASLIFGVINGLNDFVGGFGIDYLGGSLRSRTTTLGVVGIIWSLMCLLPYYPLFVTHRSGVAPDTVIPSSEEILDLFYSTDRGSLEEDDVDLDYPDLTMEPPDTVDVGWKFTLLSLATLDTGATLCTLMTGALLVAVTHNQKERVHIAFVSEMASLVAAFCVRFAVAAAWEAATGGKPQRSGYFEHMSSEDYARFEEDELEEAVIARFWPLVVLISLGSCASFVVAMLSFLGRYCGGTHRHGKLTPRPTPLSAAVEALDVSATKAVRDGSFTLNSRSNVTEDDNVRAKLVNVTSVDAITTNAEQLKIGGADGAQADADAEPFSLRDFLQILCVQQNFWAFVGTNMLLEVQVTTFYTFCLIYGRTLLPESMRHLIIAVIPLASSLVYLFKILPYVEEHGVNEVYRALISFKLYAAFFSAICLIPFGRHAIGVFMIVDAILTGATASLFSITMGEVIDEGHNLHLRQRGFGQKSAGSPSVFAKEKVDDEVEEEQPRFAACYAGVYGLFAKTLGCIPSIIGAGYGLGLDSGEEDMKLVTIFVLILPFFFAIIQRMCWSRWTLSGSDAAARSSAARNRNSPRKRPPSVVVEP